MQTEGETERVYILCLNPHCLKSQQRCLTTRTLHNHPAECSRYYYPVDEILKKEWSQLENYPLDNLGAAARRKYMSCRDGNYLLQALQVLRKKLEAQLAQIENKITQLYPSKEFERCFAAVYRLDNIVDALHKGRSTGHISSLINHNFSAPNYHVLLRLNESYDDMRVQIESLGTSLLSNFHSSLRKQPTALTPSSSKHQARKISYGIFKSKFVGSLKIQVQKTKVMFPRLANIASFLPWVYSDQSFREGTHSFKICSLKHPLVPNAGFTVLPEQDIDTYPYSNFKSLFSREGRGFTLVKGEHIDQIVAQSTVLVLRLELGPHPKALIFDSEVSSQYECMLPEGRAYRMGLYGCGWSADIIQLS